MRKDDDLIRSLLFKYEAEPDWLLMMPGTTLSHSEAEHSERYHVLLMMDEGLIAGVGVHTIRLTSHGHAFLEAIRNDTIWNRTKSVGAEVGGVSVRVLFDIATALVRQKVTELTGIPI